ncbi:hypothetical protein FJT64_006704 [Amphibalanus amphitrite]|uniref:Uncharacterized protein n=1 Tax=Amphibalanus amphitrite TaxID=1232801 RepID=A0A6A4VMF8_AMPAM|nr:hypothetical protein FJT64_006704 [Amphibalanus amphitrite]
MPKRRKVCSPAQEGQSDGDICAELKEFIARENAKCVKEIRDSNDKRLVAIEESLSFAMDSLTAVSERQHSADTDILQLQKETAELRRRLQQMELAEDRRQQEGRLTSLVFSGPAIQTQTRREDAARRIQTLVQQHMRHALDPSQGRAQAVSGEGPRGPALRREEWRRRERGRTPSEFGVAMELEVRSPGVASGSAAPDSRSPPVGSGGAADRGRPGASSSPLLDCAREAPVGLVRLSPPLEAVPTAGAVAAADRSAGGGGGTPRTRSRSASPGVRPSAAAGALGPPLPVTSGAGSPPLPAPVSGESGRRGETPDV